MLCKGRAVFKVSATCHAMHTACKSAFLLLVTLGCALAENVTLSKTAMHCCQCNLASLTQVAWHVTYMLVSQLADVS